MRSTSYGEEKMRKRQKIFANIFVNRENNKNKNNNRKTYQRMIAVRRKSKTFKLMHEKV